MRFVRLFRGMKQEELAEKIGLGGGENGRTRISQYENGKRTPKEDLLEKISDALQIDSFGANPQQLVLLIIIGKCDINILIHILN
ncbi:MAG: helix-turn-helix domain-containing protein [Coprobacillus cateniformis]|nr:helix-turn-helix transcriptional regulator [Thomasclavelia ramosa]